MSKKRKLRWLSRAVSFFRNVTGRQKDELDIAAEVSAHLELLIEEMVRSCGYPWTEMFCGSWDFFNKTPTSNWKVVWHQDLTIAVRERKTAEGFGPWTTKNGVLHVQPPAEIMDGILAIRLDLDESASDNGPLRVIPGSHRQGRISAERISSWDKQESITCTVPKGGALLMRPLLLHASSACAVPNPRRVIHLEFAAAELPDNLDWHERCRPN